MTNEQELELARMIARTDSSPVTDEDVERQEALEEPPLRWRGEP